MENASKALIIAGAILLSILIIGMGMFIYNKAYEQVANAGSKMNSHEKKVFNEQFTTYEGEKVSGTQVRKLIENGIVAAAEAAEAEDTTRLPNWDILGQKVLKPGTGEEALDTYNKNLSKERYNIKDRATYTIKTGQGASGLVDNINISLYKANTTNN